MISLQETLQRIQPADQRSGELSKKRWDSIAKPLGSLGLLEEAVVRISSVQGTADCRIDKRAVLIFCADNGVVCEGVTQCDSSVTAVVAGNFLSGDTSVCIMAGLAGADIIPVDIGMNADVPGMISLKPRYGTGNIAREPAMSRQEAVRAVEAGIEMVRRLSEEGYQLIATGEMGIGNTTTSSAVASALTGLSVREMTGRGAGLSSAGLVKKQTAIRQALELHRPDPEDVVGVLAKVGGLDLAGLTGAFLGCAALKIPAVIDGFISATAALCAVRLCPAAGEYLLASHQSGEPASRIIMEELGLSPFLDAGMRLGEGTGAVAALPVLDMSLAVYRRMSTFEEIEIEAYQPLT
ncbi:nicotinate-nucleotide--dimethylbenzimidazole phosphoribosyltransferase [Massiliimalia massiliensis]|uniref:nicotinate-nucleotide--dimethylbenzimidazole phosphoribosyltransferase n=1 Tax=Massiliimalia massiliensis TaxID=1852384 RepID=UPI002D218DE5|nr:nicotinate-nucleotide--dimethylbenzimidazole phosphoribosyltransferase [Massiliimalia massiliensis]